MNNLFTAVVVYHRAWRLVSGLAGRTSVIGQKRLAAIRRRPCTVGCTATLIGWQQGGGVADRGEYGRAYPTTRCREGIFLFFSLLCWFLYGKFADLRLGLLYSCAFYEFFFRPIYYFFRAHRTIDTDVAAVYPVSSLRERSFFTSSLHTRTRLQTVRTHL